MKIAIRCGVFETNSSSTHSFTIVSAEEKEKRKQKVDALTQQILKLKEQEETEGEKYPIFDERSIRSQIEKLKDKAEREMVSFEIKSPLAKLIWLKGLIDNAKSLNGDYQVADEDRLSDEEILKVVKERLTELDCMTEEMQEIIEDDLCYGFDPMPRLVRELRLSDTDYWSFSYKYPQIEVDYPKNGSYAKEVDEFYGYLKEEYCKIENITAEEADDRILIEGTEFIPFEVILRHPEDIEEEVKRLLEFNHTFENFAKKYKDKVQAFKDFVKKFNAEDYKNCNGKIRCDHYFEEGALNDCYCGFEDYDSIYFSLEKASKGLSLKEFAKEFITEKYSVIGTEWWNAFCVNQSDEVF